jgi:ribosomal protein S4E
MSVFDMKNKTTKNLKDGVSCRVVAGTYEGKSGIVRDINTSKTGHVTITVVQSDGIRFKTLAKNVEIPFGVRNQLAPAS